MACGCKRRREKLKALLNKVIKRAKPTPSAQQSQEGQAIRKQQDK